MKIKSGLILSMILFNFLKFLISISKFFIFLFNLNFLKLVSSGSKLFEIP